MNDDLNSMMSCMDDYAKPSMDYVANAKLSVNPADDNPDGVASIVCNDTGGIYNSGLSKAITMDPYYKRGIDIDYEINRAREFVEQNKEEVSEYFSINWDIEKTRKRIAEIDKVRETLENEHIDVDITELNLKKSQLKRNLDELCKRWYVITSTKPDVVSYANRLASSYEYLDLYPYERSLELADMYNIPPGTSRSERIKYAKRILLAKGHADDPGPTGVQGITGYVGNPGCAGTPIFQYSHF